MGKREHALWRQRWARQRWAAADLHTSTHCLPALQHMATEFVEKSAAAAVDTMVPQATVIHAPVLTGGAGVAALEAFYEKDFIPRCARLLWVVLRVGFCAAQPHGWQGWMGA